MHAIGQSQSEVESSGVCAWVYLFFSGQDAPGSVVDLESGEKGSQIILCQETGELGSGSWREA